MSKPTFTPGPWRWADWNTTFGQMESKDLCDRRTLEAGIDGEEPRMAERGSETMRILGLDDPMENEADMRLIAAAPDLLAALVGVNRERASGRLCFCDMSIGHPLVHSHTEACKAATAAIAKAVGV